MRIRVATVLAASAALAVVPSGAPASSARACHAPNGQIAHLRAGGVSCTFAGYFAKGFGLGAVYHRSPYKASYRGFRCTLAGSATGRTTVDCTRRRARLHFVQAAP